LSYIFYSFIRLIHLRRRAIFLDFCHR